MHTANMPSAKVVQIFLKRAPYMSAIAYHSGQHWVLSFIFTFPNVVLLLKLILLKSLVVLCYPVAPVFIFSLSTSMANARRGCYFTHHVSCISWHIKEKKKAFEFCDSQNIWSMGYETATFPHPRLHSLKYISEQFTLRGYWRLLRSLKQ